MVTSFCFGEHRGGLLWASAAECLSQKATAWSGKEGEGCIRLCWWVQVRGDEGQQQRRGSGVPSLSVVQAWGGGQGTLGSGPIHTLPGDKTGQGPPLPG